ncbi:hypothetical protein M413DRAFT_6464 [Hebeloma cylindrosporum]|uniref:rRNA-processing protein FYV7 n=1 Tax=Hebeloma cylindrosporum TaxID=76867 RepID=A0A0C2Z8D9_HEBCY|nr:hypothetical protein M413DRAFT_6464 [Hebeloma cylindrosporum h7]
MAGTKRKKPPTFQHLPVHRAKTLKKAWVEKTKIKSKWKAQKRKEGLDSAAKLDLPVYDEVEENNDKADEASGEGSGTSPQPQPQAPRAQASHLHPSRAHIHPGIPVRKTVKTASDALTNSEEKPRKKRKLSKAEGDEAAATEPPSVRDLMKEAYSRSTLHTFKADPLKRHRQNSSGRGGGRARPEVGRGQPNMKLRMNAMLAKIKQDYT